ncbi:MAG: universal stress protein [Anaerolineales bacterium]|nr:universal stress protein [Anaerolineales bacterium]
MLFKKILVPLDGSTLAEMALEPALALAQAAKGEVILLSVLPAQESMDVPYYGFEVTPMPADVAMLQDSQLDYRNRLVSYLDSVYASRAGSGVAMRTMVTEGNAAGCVLETAVSEHANLIVMGTHGRSGMSRWLLGSVTEKVLHHAGCPVLAVRGPAAINNILVLVDPALLAVQALDPGFALAGALQAQLHLLLVDSHATGDVEEVFRQEEGYLEDLCERYAIKQRPETAVRFGKPEEVIAAYSEEQSIDLIVLTDHDRSGFRRWLSGSLFEKVLHKTSGSLLLVRAESHD